MATLQERATNGIPLTIQERLRRLRWWIRAYVSWEGLMAALVWMGVAFWASLVLDWFFEPARPVRIFMWLVAASGLAWILFWQVLRRLVVRFTEANLAMLLERRFPELNETLLTTVEVAARPERARHFNPQMLDLACREAETRIQPLRLREVFNFRPLYKATTAALLLALSIGVWMSLYPEAFAIWCDRMLAFSDRLWPRRTVLLVDGFDKPVKVGRGADLEVIARVDLEKSQLVPSAVYIRGRTEEGARIRATMNRIGNAQPGKDKYQLYAYTFQGILWDIQFDLHGGDAWIEGLQIDVVDNPTLSDLTVECEYPAYMARSPQRMNVIGLMQIPQGTKVTIHATANKDLQTVQIHSLQEPNRPPVLLDYQQHKQYWLDRQHFRYLIERLEEDTILLFTLLDTDGIRSREPVRLSLAAKPDEKPQLEVRLRGIGQAITPQARIPAIGRITDDYGLGRIWWEYTIQKPEKSPQSQPKTPPENTAAKSPPESKSAPDEKGSDTEKTDQVSIASLDTLRLDYSLNTALEVSDLDVLPGQKLLLAIKAADRCDRHGAPNVASSDRWVLDVVTPDQLRLMLEARELTLRQRFEVVIREVEEVRELLTRMEFPSSAPKGQPKPAATGALSAPNAWSFVQLLAEPPSSEPPSKPLSSPSSAASPQDNLQKPTPDEKSSGAASPSEAKTPRTPSEGLEPGEEPTSAEPLSPELLRNRALLTVQRTQNTIIKDRNDLLDLAEAFEQILEEMINNRIDSERMRRRLKEGIADPLRQVADELMPRVEQHLYNLQKNLDQPEEGPRYRFLAVQQLDAILVQLQEILRQMIELETFNEVLATLRTIIEQQEKLHQETQQYHKERLRKLLQE
ncbi:MAG: hypothetical protein NZ602_07440 [Thermoguttaceae bacterium]|nr:hypothetical protein [Thermoguttaceae bacterium]MDW8037757.1 hypothetical protein [Thermoguttaceae bacterium]